MEILRSFFTYKDKYDLSFIRPDVENEPSYLNRIFPLECRYISNRQLKQQFIQQMTPITENKFISLKDQLQFPIKRANYFNLAVSYNLNATENVIALVPIIRESDRETIGYFKCYLNFPKFKSLKILLMRLTFMDAEGDIKFSITRFEYIDLPDNINLETIHHIDDYPRGYDIGVSKISYFYFYTEESLKKAFPFYLGIFSLNEDNQIFCYEIYHTFFFNIPIFRRFDIKKRIHSQQKKSSKKVLMPAKTHTGYSQLK